MIGNYPKRKPTRLKQPRKRRRLLLRLRGLTLEEAGIVLGVKKERARQLFRLFRVRRKNHHRGPSRWKAILAVCAIVALAASLVSCGNPQDKARKELAALNKEYSTKAFIATAANNDLAAIKLYFAAGMSPNAAADDGDTALSAAASRGNAPLVKLLLENGANPNTTLREGRLKGVTPLMLAVTATDGSVETVTALLNKQADANLIDAEGWNALMFAVRDGRVDVTRLLIPKIRDINAKNGEGHTAADLSMNLTSLTIMGMLQNAGANLISDKFAKEALDELAGKIKGSIRRSSKAMDVHPIQDTIVVGLSRLERAGFSAEQMAEARRAAHQAVLDGISAFDLATRTSQRTDADREMDNWHRTLLARIDAELKQAESTAVPSNQPGAQTNDH